MVVFIAERFSGRIGRIMESWLLPSQRGETLATLSLPTNSNRAPCSIEFPKSFMQFLKSTQDGEDRMLDNTMILFGSGMNSGEGGDHSPKNLPLLVAGGSVHLTLAQKMGVETEKFSDATGTLTGRTQSS